jgi:hypothetical protein
LKPVRNQTEFGETINIMLRRNVAQQQNIDRSRYVTPSGRFAFLSAMAIAAGISLWGTQPHAQIALPDDAEPRCKDLAEIQGWFDRDGNVKPPDNEHFGQSRNGALDGKCIFFETAMRMFLWLTSVDHRQDGEPIYVYDSPLFYRVGPLDKDKMRPLIRNDGTRRADLDDISTRSFTASTSQLSADNFAVVFDDMGGIHRFVSRPRSRKVTRADCDAPPPNLPARAIACPGENDIASATPAIASPVPPSAAPPCQVAAGDRRPSNFICVNGLRVRLDRKGQNAIVTTPGQVCDKVLISQKNKIVYYDIEVNDVVAYFRSGLKGFHFKNFPTGAPIPTPAKKDIVEIDNYAKSHQASLPDKKALAIEIKTSWIEIDDQDKDRFVTTWATIPAFRQDSATHWRADRLKQARLGLVGMHIVFSVKEHPEMIWATFEHVDNAPDQKYAYCQRSDRGGDCKTIVAHGRDQGTKWIFSTNTPQSDNNLQRAYLYKGDICGYNTNTIGSNDVLRTYPWGSQQAQINTDIININENVLESLPDEDIRRNYLLRGAIWTGGGIPPGVSREGSAKLVNMTMETFFQGSDCFACHNDPMSPPTVGMSHVFDLLRRLFTR